MLNIERQFIALGILFGIVLSLFYLLGDNDTFSVTYPYFLLALLGFIVLYYYVNRSRNNKLANWGLRPTYICLIGIIIVNSQFFIDQSIGFSSVADALELTWVNLYLDKCFFATCIFTIIFLISNIIPRQGLYSKKTIAPSFFTIRCWLLLQFTFFILFILNIDLYTFITGQVYSGSGASDAAGGLSGSFERFYNATYLITLSLYVKSYLEDGDKSISKFIKRIPILFWLPLAIYIVLRMFSGDRGPMLYSCLTVLYAFFLISHKTINLKWSIGIVLIGAFLVSLLGYVRSRSSELSFLEKVQQAASRMDEKNTDGYVTISPYTKELAHSSLCNYIAIRDIETGKTGFSLGKYSFLSAISSFPGANKGYFSPFGLSEEDFSSAIYFTKSFNESESYNYGIGSSVFGEAYLDSGLIGIMLVAFILGYLFKRIDLSYQNSTKLSVVDIIVILKLSSVAIYISRASMAMIIDQILSILIIFWIFSFICDHFKIKIR